MPERAAWTLFVVALALQAAAPFLMDPWEDGGEYAALGRALSEGRGMWLPFGEAHAPQANDGAPAWSHHDPPGFPFYLSLAYRVAGFGLAQTRAAMAILGVATTLIVAACARDLFGARAGLWSGAFVGLDPLAVWATGRAYSEDLALLLFALTLWAILKSLREPRWILAGGVFAGLAYLTRAGMGAFFVVAGLAGLAWRLRHRGLASLCDPWYAAGAALFGLIVGAWAWRNVSLFGGWQTSAYVEMAIAGAATQPARWALGALGKSVLLAAGLAPLLLLRPRLARDEETTALWLAAGLVVALGAFLSAALWIVEPVSLVYGEHARYALPALVPLAWLGLRERRGAPLAVAAIFLVASVAVVAAPMRDSEARAAEAIAPLVGPGEEVGLVYMTAYEPYLWLPQAKLTPFEHAHAPRFVLSDLPDAPPGYHLWRDVRLDGPLRHTQTWVFERDVSPS